jgi:hypothetical protein
MNNNNGNSNNNSNRVSLTNNQTLNKRPKKDNNSNNNITNVNTSNTINNSENTSTFNNVVIDNNTIIIKTGNNKIINIYDNNNVNNNSKKNSNNNFNPQKLKIKIIKGRIRKDKSGKPYLEYIININYNNITNWNISRRFNQFTNLYKTLRTLSKDNFELPESSNIFNNITALFSGLSHENKIFQLEKFLKDLTDTEGIFNSKYLFWFLELNHLTNDNNNITIDGNINNYQRKNVDISKIKINNNH